MPKTPYYFQHLKKKKISVPEDGCFFCFSSRGERVNHDLMGMHPWVRIEQPELNFFV